MQEKTQAPLSVGDWVMAAVSFFLTPLVPLILTVYNLSMGRRPRVYLYLAVIGFQIAVLVLLSLNRR